MEAAYAGLVTMPATCDADLRARRVARQHQALRVDAELVGVLREVREGVEQLEGSGRVGGARRDRVADADHRAAAAGHHPQVVGDEVLAAGQPRAAVHPDDRRERRRRASWTGARRGGRRGRRRGTGCRGWRPRAPGTNGAVAVSRSAPLRSNRRRITTDAGFGLSQRGDPEAHQPGGQQPDQPGDREPEASHLSIVAPCAALATWAELGGSRRSSAARTDRARSRSTELARALEPRRCRSDAGERSRQGGPRLRGERHDGAAGRRRGAVDLARRGARRRRPRAPGPRRRARRRRSPARRGPARASRRGATARPRPARRSG